MKKAKFSIIFACFLFQIHCCSVAKSCLTLDRRDCSTPGFPVLHRLPELAPTHIHSDVTQPSRPLSSPSPAFNISQHQGLFPSESALHIRWPKYWSFSFSISPPNEYSGLIQVPPGKHLSFLKMAIFQIHKNATQGNICPELQFCLVTSLR